MTYFTCYITDGGLTDQLRRFYICYKIGISLGYQYIHTPLFFSRSSNQVSNFIGINDYFTKNIDTLPLENCKFVEINLGLLLNEHNFTSLKALQSFITQYVITQHISNIFSSSKKAIIVKFLLTHNIVSAPPILSNWVRLHLTDVPDEINFRQSYLKAREKSPRTSRFTDGQIKLLVHIRQGDIAIIETPWQTFIDVKAIRRNKFIESRQINDINKEYIHTSEFFDFLQQFLTYFKKSVFSIIVSSDGYKRGFETIYEKCKNLNFFTDEQIDELKQIENSYDQNKFAPFQKLENCLCLIGENDENLFDFIHSSLTADIIIVGTQQQLISKLLALYADVNNPPILIVLHKKLKSPNYNEYGLDERLAKIILVNLNNIDFKNIVDKIDQKFADKIKVD